MKYLKGLGIVLLIVVIGFAGALIYFLNFHKEIPKTQANVNTLASDEFLLEEATLTNRWNDQMAVQQGWVVVPEKRGDSKSNLISISFIRIPSKNPSPEEPVFFLAGGPGTPASAVAKSSYFYVFKKLAEVSDVVLIDQRAPVIQFQILGAGIHLICLLTSRRM